MKVLIVLAVACATAHAGFIGGGHGGGGTSTQHRSQDISGAYSFGYNENHATGGTSRWESGDGVGNKRGSYSLRGADGRWRTVKYVADGAGFRAAVSTNEPGTAPSSPASAGINAPILHVPAGHHDGGYGGYAGAYGAGAYGGGAYLGGAGYGAGGYYGAGAGIGAGATKAAHVFGAAIPGTGFGGFGGYGGYGGGYGGYGHHGYGGHGIVKHY
nr:cuticle protein 14-like [Rhipicephalus microplus]